MHCQPLRKFATVITSTLDCCCLLESQTPILYIYCYICVSLSDHENRPREHEYFEIFECDVILRFQLSDLLTLGRTPV